jgi:ribosomal protein S18 acetylase RimI-like enzyme
MEIRIIETEKTYPLRIEILRKGIARDYKFVGDEDKYTFHVGAFINDECVGIGSCMKKEHTLFKGENVYQLRGMAVKKDIQKKGIGKEIVLKTEEILKDRNCSLIWFNAREIAVGFYEKLGYKIIGEKFQIPKVGSHYVMFREL